MPICNIVTIMRLEGPLEENSENASIDIIKVDSSLKIFRNTNFLSFVL